ncbi:hypothetical protein [Rickettsia tamurae]|nr:hypothetical protein [Rickettsia tamurae]
MLHDSVSSSLREDIYVDEAISANKQKIATQSTPARNDDLVSTQK